MDGKGLVPVLGQTIVSPGDKPTKETADAAHRCCTECGKHGDGSRGLGGRVPRTRAPVPTGAVMGMRLQPSQTQQKGTWTEGRSGSTGSVLLFLSTSPMADRRAFPELQGTSCSISFL